MSYSNQQENYVACFMCNQWQRKKYTVLVPFNGLEEEVCLQCYNLLQAREDNLETERRRHEYEKRKESGELEMPSEADHPGGAGESDDSSENPTGAE